jgi:sulfite exporter TauE/SafE
VGILFTAFIIGFTGSFHCVGMCGPLAMALPMQQNGKKLPAIMLYLLGKTITYSLLGGLFGLFGSRLVIAGLQQAMSISLGFLLFAITLCMLFKKAWFHQGIIASWISTQLSPLFIQLLNTDSRYSAVVFGMLNGLLPCGLVYMGIIGAIATGSIINGMLFMALFGIGTMPIMLSFLLMAKQFSFSFKRTIQKITPYLMMLMAVLLIVRGLGLSIPYVSPDLSGAVFLEKANTKVGCHP